MERNASVFKALFLSVLMLAPAAAFAAGGGGHADSGAVLKDFIYRCFNFALMAGLLAYFVTKPIRKGLKGRTEEIEKTLADAESAKAAGGRTLARSASSADIVEPDPAQRRLRQRPVQRREGAGRPL